MSKIATGIVAVLIVASSSLALTYYLANQGRSQELNLAQKQLDNLSEQLERNVEARRKLLGDLEDARAQLAQSGDRYRQLSDQVDDLQQQVDPDYAELEQELRASIRQEIAAEQQVDAVRQTQATTGASLIQELSQLDPQERMAVFSVQAQYGEFVNSLNVSTQRRDAITNALLAMTEETRLVREDLMRDLQSATDRQERAQMIQQQMMKLTSKEYRLESLSYALTDQELQSFGDFIDSSMQNQAAYAISGAPLRAGFISGAAPMPVDNIRFMQGPGPAPLGVKVNESAGTWIVWPDGAAVDGQ